MQRTPCICETQEQATRRVLIVRIILNNGGALTGFTNISLANISLNGTFERMPTEHINQPLSLRKNKQA
jgi:hypothetical protein